MNKYIVCLKDGIIFKKINVEAESFEIHNGEYIFRKHVDYFLIICFASPSENIEYIELIQ